MSNDNIPEEEKKAREIINSMFTASQQWNGKNISGTIAAAKAIYSEIIEPLKKQRAELQEAIKTFSGGMKPIPMIGKTDLWGIFKEHQKETGKEFTAIEKNHILELIQRVNRFQNKDESGCESSESESKGFLAVLEENYQAAKSEEATEDCFAGETKKSAVIEIYEDLIAIFKHGKYGMQEGESVSKEDKQP